MKPDNLTDVDELLIRGLNWIGDAVMSLPTLWKIREATPGAGITVLSHTWCADIYRICPAVDEVVEVPENRSLFGMMSEFNVANILKQGNFDTALLLPNSFRSAVAPFIAGIPRRIGYKTDGRTMLLTDGMHQKRRSENHTVLYYRPLLQQFGIPWKEGTERFDLDVDEQILWESSEILKAKNVLEDHDLIGFSPGAAWGPSKRWPAEHFREAARIICSIPGRQAVFFGSPGDTEIISSIAGGLDTPFAHLAGAFEHLRHLVAAIKQCDLLVTNDSGPMHIAAAVGTPVIALFGPTNEKVSGPWVQAGCKALILRAPGCSPCYNPACSPEGISCLSRISPEEVGRAAESILAK